MSAFTVSTSRKPKRRWIGLAVIASRECGIPRWPGVATVPAGDASALCAALENLLFGRPAPLAAKVA